MGTSGAYGGSSGWGNVGSGTQSWIDDGGPNAPGGPGDGGDPGARGTPDGSDRPTVSPRVGRIIRRIGGHLGSGGGGGGGGGGSRGGGDGSSSGGGGGAGRSTARASRVGGRAVAGVNALRAGSAEGLAELGLSLDELRGLDRWQQAQRLQEAATGASGEVTESELRLANAELILWALNEEGVPTPVELANRWVVEYVWQVWVTEAGQRLTSQVDSPADRLSYEAEMRAGLEAMVSAKGLPDDRPLVTADFEKAIGDALRGLHQIEGSS